MARNAVAGIVWLAMSEATCAVELHEIVGCMTRRGCAAARGLQGPAARPSGYVQVWLALALAVVTLHQSSVPRQVCDVGELCCVIYLCRLHTWLRDVRTKYTPGSLGMHGGPAHHILRELWVHDGHVANSWPITFLPSSIE